MKTPWSCRCGWDAYSGLFMTSRTSLTMSDWNRTPTKRWAWFTKLYTHLTACWRRCTHIEWPGRVQHIGIGWGGGFDVRSVRRAWPWFPFRCTDRPSMAWDGGTRWRCTRMMPTALFLMNETYFHDVESVSWKKKVWRGVFRILFYVLLTSHVENIQEATISRVFPVPAVLRILPISW